MEQTRDLPPNFAEVCFVPPMDIRTNYLISAKRKFQSLPGAENIYALARKPIKSLA